MERLPQKFEIWKYNADEDMKVIEFCTQEVIEEIDKVSESIKEWFYRCIIFRIFFPQSFCHFNISVCKIASQPKLYNPSIGTMFPDAKLAFTLILCRLIETHHFNAHPF